MSVRINNVRFREAVAVFRRFGFEVVDRHRGRGSHVVLSNGIISITLTDWSGRSMKGSTLGSQVERAGIDVTAFLWALGRENRRGHPAPQGWRPGMPVPEDERDRG